ncbi:MAG: TlpA family protein disulfide reductase [Lentisphaerae bacterium]|nr:TlpA family protein disulfide reductase [Lentisphaerota bacterium]
MYCKTKQCGCRERGTVSGRRSGRPCAGGLSPLRAVLLGVLLWVSTGGAGRAEWATGTRLPELQGAGLAGSLPALKGKVVLVDFWASWCAPCKKSFPELDQLSRDYASRGLVVLAISVDESAEAMAAFLDKHPVSFAVVRDAQQKIVGAAGVESMPSSFIVDRAGTIRFVHSGFHGADTVARYRQEIDALLAP